MAGEAPSEPTEADLAGIEQEVMQMGANDSEIGFFRNLWDRFRKGLISLKDAIAEAIKVRDSKQGYH